MQRIERMIGFDDDDEGCTIVGGRGQNTLKYLGPIQDENEMRSCAKEMIFVKRTFRYFC